MTVKLFFSAIIKFLLGVALVGVLIFLPAGTLTFFNGWLLVGVFLVSKTEHRLRHLKRLFNIIGSYF